MMLYTDSVANQTDLIADAFVHKNVAYSYDVVTTSRYDVQKFTTGAILFREIQCM